MSVALNIKLKKVDKVYHEGENVTGVISINCPSDLKHDGITLSMEGNVNLQLSSKNVGILEAFYNSVKPIQLISLTCEVSGPGRIPSGCTEIPFELPLQPRPNRELYETYHGVFINISYSLKCDVKRSFLSKDLQKIQQFLVQYRPKVTDPPRPVSFTISPASLASGGAGAPNFLIKGKFDSTRCSVSSPLTGYLVFEHCAVPIKSVELQLVRVETCGCAEGYARDATEIQNIQIGDGDIPHNTEIPIYMIFPRLFTCPSLTKVNFKIGGKFNVRRNRKMVSCIACGLSHNARKLGVTFHRFPKRPEVYAAWVQFLNKTDESLPKFAVLCSQHFEESDFDKSAFRVFLNRNAVPSKFIDRRRYERMFSDELVVVVSTDHGSSKLKTQAETPDPVDTYLCSPIKSEISVDGSEFTIKTETVELTDISACSPVKSESSVNSELSTKTEPADPMDTYLCSPIKSEISVDGSEFTIKTETVGFTDMSACSLFKSELSVNTPREEELLQQIRKLSVMNLKQSQLIRKLQKRTWFQRKRIHELSSTIKELGRKTLVSSDQVSNLMHKFGRNKNRFDCGETIESKNKGLIICGGTV